MKIEIAVADNIADSVVKILREKAMTGKIGDGKIFITDLEETIRIRTGERGETAI